MTGPDAGWSDRESRVDVLHLVPELFGNIFHFLPSQMAPPFA